MHLRMANPPLDKDEKVVGSVIFRIDEIAARISTLFGHFGKRGTGYRVAPLRCMPNSPTNPKRRCATR